MLPKRYYDMTNEEDRVGDWGQSFRGEKFWPLDPRPEDIHIVDIAHALSLVCRYNGHCKFHYSVAQHSVLCSQAAPEHLRLEALMHDASEAYLCDIPRNFKSALKGYAELEERMMNVIAKKYGFNWPVSPLVKEIDNRVLLTEKLFVLNPGPGWNLDKSYSPYSDLEIKSIQPLEAEKQFLLRFEELTKSESK